MPPNDEPPAPILRLPPELLAQILSHLLPPRPAPKHKHSPRSNARAHFLSLSHTASLTGFISLLHVNKAFNAAFKVYRTRFTIKLCESLVQHWAVTRAVARLPFGPIKPGEKREEGYRTSIEKLAVEAFNNSSPVGYSEACRMLYIHGLATRVTSARASAYLLPADCRIQEALPLLARDVGTANVLMNTLSREIGQEAWLALMGRRADSEWGGKVCVEYRFEYAGWIRGEVKAHLGRRVAGMLVGYPELALRTEEGQVGGRFGRGECEKAERGFREVFGMSLYEFERERCGMRYLEHGYLDRCLLEVAVYIAEHASLQWILAFLGASCDSERDPHIREILAFLGVEKWRRFYSEADAKLLKGTYKAEKGSAMSVNNFKARHEVASYFETLDSWLRSQSLRAADMKRFYKSIRTRKSRP